MIILELITKYSMIAPKLQVLLNKLSRDYIIELYTNTKLLPTVLTLYFF